jgi:transcriptional regulator with XRE-family HTH domain
MVQARMLYGHMLGQNIRMARESKGIKQADLARMLGIQPLRLWRYESGRARISVDLVAEISRKLGVTTDSLIHGPSVEQAEVAGEARR